MSEIMRPIPFPDLIRWVQAEYKNHGSVFGIRKEKFFRGMSVPVGPAAGPNSQLAQNILAAFLAGSRYIELKTVQIMDGDELRKAVSRPCINAADEGYNVEWSTELTVSQAMDEYIKAWFLCHIFAKEFNLTDDVIFNMSVGYSLDGIKSEKIDSFIEGMKNASNTRIWKQCYSYISDEISLFNKFTKKDLDVISPAVSPGITLSTLHGCPSEEIEKIAAYLIREKGLNTFIKCNPTLLGYETARALLDDTGYGYVSFNDHHFNNDLQFDDAVKILHRVKTYAEEAKVGFGVKLTNTFPVEIKRNELPGKEMYMSGSPLFPLSINTAKKISEAFNGEMPISYSGGADFFNIKAILETGIKPVTVATTILKPGGYERLTQLTELAQQTLLSLPSVNASVINNSALNNLIKELPSMKRYQKNRRPPNPLDQKVNTIPLLDCSKAPCIDGCPINMDIPEYLAASASGGYDDAFRIIIKDNTAPSITGTICDHNCQNKCTRIDYEDPLQIRKAKLTAASNAQQKFISSLSAPLIKTDGISAAVIGAGPAGIASAVFLRRNGVPVTVYEKRDRPYGAVQYLIPSFRISDETILSDYRLAEKTGVQFEFNVPENYSINELKKKHKFIIITTGAWKESPPVVKQGQEKIIDALQFLEDSKNSNLCLDIGKRIAVIGGGDVAMDCARAAKRNKGVESVTIIYRRTREFMPAQLEEQKMALADGVVFCELLAPETWDGSILTCEKMLLGDYDSSGRRNIKSTGIKQEFNFDTVISATGAGIETELFTHNNITVKGGFPSVNSSLESSLPDVYIAGDCLKGASTVVNAIADGKTAAADILKKLKLTADFIRPPVSCPGSLDKINDADLYIKKGIIVEAKNDDSENLRCLSCNVLCEICADVCPNRANVSVILPAYGKRPKTRQIVHIDRMCNECGNCATFCPYSGKPYRDKFTVFSNQEDFNDSENPGFVKTDDSYNIRLEDKSIVEYMLGEKNIPYEYAFLLETLNTDYEYILI